jgi:hypothetical protein
VEFGLEVANSFGWALELDLDDVWIHLDAGWEYQYQTRLVCCSLTNCNLVRQGEASSLQIHFHRTHMEIGNAFGCLHGQCKMHKPFAL